ncbi:MAG: undecaprenyldiphospho-muramoylpentapeptide beta-N-acetylglucosaminyltransferase, partial [Pseudomonadota bacterium]
MVKKTEGKLTILLATGGTGGHIFPAISVAQELKKRGHDVMFLVDKRFNEKYIKMLGDIKVFKINSAPLSGNIIKKFISSIKITHGILQSLLKLKKLKPDMVIGFGGYPSFPTIIASILQARPFMLHEQNSILGKVNRLFSKKARHVATSFPDVSVMGNKHVTNIGNPVRESFLAMQNDNYTDFDNKFYLLITGGSMGATIFSEIVPKALAALDRDLRYKIIITHQCGKGDNPEEIKEQYYNIGIESEVDYFFNDIDQKIFNSHLIICRAGASTIAEIATVGRPAIMVPYPYSADNHQYYNALHVETNNGGWLYKQEDFSEASLSRKLIELLNNKNKLSYAANQMKKLNKPQAAENFSNLIEEYF